MTEIKECSILFDDAELLEAVLGKESLNISSINANCDCVSYLSSDDDDKLDTEIIPRPLAKAS